MDWGFFFYVILLFLFPIPRNQTEGTLAMYVSSNSFEVYKNLQEFPINDPKQSLLQTEAIYF